MKNHQKAWMSALLFSSMATTVNAEVTQVERYAVNVAAKDYVSYDGHFADRFPQGFVPGLGSGLMFAGKNSAGELQFFALTDRGPNGKSPKVTLENGKKSASKIFPSPHFVPQWMTVTLSNGKAYASNPVQIKDANGPISGLPLGKGVIGSTNEVALNDQLKSFNVSVSNGLDTEGLVADSQGGYWICDEYGPFIAHLDSTGKITEKYGPQPLAGEQSVAGGLPNIVKWRQPNRGFEGIARTPSGKIYAAVQSTLNVNGETRNSARFTRIVEFDPATKETRMLAYPHDISAYKNSKDAKIGDLVALNNHELLIVEQGKGKDKQMRNLIYRIDLSDTTDLTGKQIDGKALEYADSTALENAGIKMINKTLIADLRQHGWNADKAEGLVVVDANKLAVASDNDFGMGVNITQPTEGKKKAKNYTTDGHSGTLSYKGQPVDSGLELKALTGDDAASQLWVLHFDKAQF